MIPQNALIVHGSAIALRTPDGDYAAVLLRGQSGTGKSDLAFRLIAAGGLLICDDQVTLERRQDKIMAAAVKEIAGLIEIRGVGLVKCPVTGDQNSGNASAPQTRLRLVIDLVPRQNVPRLPEWESVDLLGISIPRLQLHAFDASTPLKIMKAIELVYKPDSLVR